MLWCGPGLVVVWSWSGLGSDCVRVRVCVFVCVRVQDMLTQHSGLFLAPLALVMLNDDSAQCKKMASLDIKVLLSRLDLTQQNALYALVQTWMAAEKVGSLTPLGSWVPQASSREEGVSALAPR